MQTSKRHYEELLASRYSWMLGDVAERADSELVLLRSLGMPEAKPGQLAIDLGCGSGLHCRVLQALGYRVLGVDQNRELLAEAHALSVEVVEADIVGFAVDDASVVTCMGDSLVHLSSWEEVQWVLERWRPGLTMAFSFRDLRNPPEGTDRFFIVRQDDRRLQTCFLEDEGGHVRVHDLFHECENGEWILRASAYLKLKLDPDRVLSFLEGLGATLRSEVTRGMCTIVAS